MTKLLPIITSLILLAQPGLRAEPQGGFSAQRERAAKSAASGRSPADVQRRQADIQRRQEEIGRRDDAITHSLCRGC